MNTQTDFVPELESSSQYVKRRGFKGVCDISSLWPTKMAQEAGKNPSLVELVSAYLGDRFRFLVMLCSCP